MASPTAGRAAQRHAAALESMQRGQWEAALSELNKATFLRSDDPQLYVHRADVFVELCDFQSAIMNLKKALRLDGTHRDAAQRLAAIYALKSQVAVDEENYSRALVLLNNALGVLPQNEDCLHRKAVVLVHLGKDPEALLCLDQCARLGSRQTEMWLFRARMYIRSGQFKEAYDNVKRAQELFPDHVDLERMLRLINESSEIYKAKANELLLIGNYREAIKKVDAALEINPTDRSLYLRKGVLLRHEGAFKDAIKVLQDAIARSDGEFAEASKQLALAYNDVAVKYFERQEYPSAVTFLNKAIGISSDSFDFFINRADCYIKLLSPQLAMADLHQALDMRPQHVGVKARLSVIHHDFGLEVYKKGLLAQAEYEFSKAVALNQTVALYYVNRAQCRYNQKKYELAKDDLVAALRLEPQNQTALRMFAQFCPRGMREEELERRGVGRR